MSQAKANSVFLFRSWKEPCDGQVAAIVAAQRALDGPILIFVIRAFLDKLSPYTLCLLHIVI